MRVSTLLDGLLELPGVRATGVALVDGEVRVMVALRRRRLRCPEDGVLAEAVPYARENSRHTRDFEQLVAWLATRQEHHQPLRADLLAHFRGDLSTRGH